jgi:hypothetical protein
VFARPLHAPLGTVSLSVGELAIILALAAIPAGAAEAAKAVGRRRVLRGAG